MRPDCEHTITRIVRVAFEQIFAKQVCLLYVQFQVLKRFPFSEPLIHGICSRKVPSRLVLSPSPHVRFPDLFFSPGLLQIVDISRLICNSMVMLTCLRRGHARPLTSPHVMSDHVDNMSTDDRASATDGSFGQELPFSSPSFKNCILLSKNGVLPASPRHLVESYPRGWQDLLECGL